jgi:phosphoglycerol transferase
MSKLFSTDTVRSFRPDLLRGLVLAWVAILLWCMFYDRWTVTSWETPVTYLSDPVKADVFETVARIKAAGDGHMMPFLFSNVPELGAPHVANWNDVPVPEKPYYCAIGLLSRMIGLFPAANFSLMLAQVLAALAFYGVCRALDCSWAWAFAGALIFAFSRYAFAQGLHHVLLVYYWHLPLCLLVCAWIFRGDGIKWGERRFIFALVVAIITAVQPVYYTNLFVQFVLFGGLLQARRHGWKASLSALAIIGATVATFLLMNANTIVYSLVYGGNDGAMVRAYKWLEVYGLKLVDLVVPPPDHPFPPFAQWGAAHLKEVVLSPGELPPTGYIGLAGLGALTWLVLVSLRRATGRGGLPLEAWLILWIIVYANVGGINGIMGTFGFQLFRTTTRYSIFILCIVLMFAVRRLSLLKIQNQMWVYAAAVFGVVVAMWDQSPPLASGSKIEQTAQQVASDRTFTEKMEQRLPAKAMVFQIPVMDFPESPVSGVGASDHFRPYLYSHQLRFSFGTDKGRADGQWQHDLAQQTLSAVIPQLESYGFSALYVNLNYFSDRGAALIKALKDMGLEGMFESDRGDLLCVMLKPSAQPVMPDGY